MPLSAMVGVRCSLSKDKRTQLAVAGVQLARTGRGGKRSLSAASGALKSARAGKFLLLNFSEWIIK
ncbi:hypothetical protein M8494_20405 [Serratia ureilytica]